MSTPQSHTILQQSSIILPVPAKSPVWCQVPGCCALQMLRTDRQEGAWKQLPLTPPPTGPLTSNLMLLQLLFTVMPRIYITLFLSYYTKKILINCLKIDYIISQKKWQTSSLLVYLRIRLFYSILFQGQKSSLWFLGSTFVRVYTVRFTWMVTWMTHSIGGEGGGWHDGNIMDRVQPYAAYRVDCLSPGRLVQTNSSRCLC